MRAMLLMSLAVLGGCTTTAARIEANPIVAAFQSPMQPRVLANCIADHMTGGDLRGDDQGHFWIVRSNAMGVIGRWDVYPAAHGSRAEWRRVSDLTTGAGAGEACQKF